MRLIVGAPVAERAWALPKWFECLDRQTVKPDGYAFVYSESKDDTLEILKARRQREEMTIELAPEVYTPRKARHTPDRSWYGVIAKLRNRLLGHAERMDADVFLSLDTDVFLTEPTAIEQLLAALKGHALSSPLVYLHHLGAESCCVNAGFWRAGEPGSPQRIWERVTPEGFEAFRKIPLTTVDLPAAAVMMRREVVQQARYRYHETGEDAGFAQDLDRLRFRTAWLPNLYCPHVMDPGALDEMVLVP